MAQIASPPQPGKRLCPPDGARGAVSAVSGGTIPTDNAQGRSRKLLTIVVPFFNEVKNLSAIVDRCLEVCLPEGWAREIILVDDGSTDGSGEIADQLARKHPEVVRVIHLPENQGKGAAVRAGYALAHGDAVIVQDADLEYEPEDYRQILEAMERSGAAAVYGSRVRGRQGTLYRRYWYGGRLVTTLNNLIYAATLSDQPTCYKCVRKEVLDGLCLTARGFEFCTELTCELLSHGHRIVEVPIHYRPRSIEEGKKIRPRDGIKAVWWMLKVLWRHLWGTCKNTRKTQLPTMCTR